MPELPEVETTLRGIAPLITGRRITAVHIRERRLRWPVPRGLAARLTGQTLLTAQRRAKYLLLATGAGHMIVHLGMSGSLRVLDGATPAGPHDHIDWVLDNGTMLRLRDPRRFGCVLWTRSEPFEHPLLKGLGPEPLSAQFNGAYLYHAAHKRRSAVKAFLMDSHIVAGVGNIYANEALFASGIHPARAAGRISAERYQRLAEAVKYTLRRAITAGGTTLRDFTRADGNPGYFRHALQVYDRAGEPCPRCARPLQRQWIGQRASFLCRSCQH